jgi:hypothetical protein
MLSLSLCIYIYPLSTNTSICVFLYRERDIHGDIHVYIYTTPELLGW